jgi:hypothetical protein
MENTNVMVKDERPMQKHLDVQKEEKLTTDQVSKCHRKN